MADSKVSICFRYAESDYIRAMQTHYASIMRLWLDISAVVIGAGLGVYLWRSGELHWLSVLSLCVAATFTLMLLVAFLIIPPLAFRREPKFRDEYCLTFSEEGIHFKTAAIDSHLDWSLYSRGLQNNSSYILYYGRRAFTVVPKRAFRDADQRMAFERLLRQKIAQLASR